MGAIEQFKVKDSDMNLYIERMEQLFVCNATNNEKK